MSGVATVNLVSRSANRKSHLSAEPLVNSADGNGLRTALFAVPPSLQTARASLGHDHAMLAYRLLDLFSPVPVMQKLICDRVLDNEAMGAANGQPTLLDVFMTFWSDPSTQQSLVEVIRAACSTTTLSKVLRFFAAPAHHGLVEKMPLIVSETASCAMTHAASDARARCFARPTNEAREDALHLLAACGQHTAATGRGRVVGFVADALARHIDAAVLLDTAEILGSVAGAELCVAMKNVADWFIDQLMSGFARTVAARYGRG